MKNVLVNGLQSRKIGLRLYRLGMREHVCPERKLSDSEMNALYPSAWCLVVLSKHVGVLAFSVKTMFDILGIATP